MTSKAPTGKNYEEVWNLLSKYQFEIDMRINADLICTICKMILKNAYQGRCGCKFCLTCVERFWNGEEKTCPGDHEECKHEKIKGLDNLYMDNSSNRRISLIKVKCPEEHCDVIEELRSMHNHIRSHEKKCPYFEMGCHKSFSKETMGQHLTVEAISHAHLLTNSVQNTKNEMQCLEKQFKQEQDIRKALEEYAADLENRIEELIEEKGLLEFQLSSYISDGDYDYGDYFDLSSDDLSDEDDDNFQSLMTLLPLTFPSTLASAPFEWTIDNFTILRAYAREGYDQYCKSDPFYSNIGRYLVQLILYPNGCLDGKGTHISVFFKILQGRYDNEQSWPMRHGITISLIDQQTGEWHTNYSTSYNSVDRNCRVFFGRYSKRCKNSHFGSSKFFNSDVLIRNNSLCRDDKVVLKCFFTD